MAQSAMLNEHAPNLSGVAQDLETQAINLQGAAPNIPQIADTIRSIAQNLVWESRQWIMRASSHREAAVSKTAQIRAFKIRASTTAGSLVNALAPESEQDRFTQKLKFCKNGTELDLR